LPLSQSFHDRLVLLRESEDWRSSSGVGKLTLAEPLDEPEDWAWSLTELSWGVDVMEEGVRS
jgi:hypothetical protein